MGTLTMSSIAVCLMFQRLHLYIIKVKSFATIDSVTKTNYFELLIRKNALPYGLFCFFFSFNRIDNNVSQIIVNHYINIRYLFP